MTAEQIATMAVPATREEAVAALVEHDVAKWGEEEREASQRTRGDLSLGLALNALANIAELDATKNKALRKAANAALKNKSDRKVLAQGRD